MTDREMADKNFVYSTNGEDFDITEFSDLLDELEIGDVYYVGEAVPLTADVVANLRFVESMLEQLDEWYYDILNWEGYDNEFSDVSADAKQELCGFLKAWCEKHVSLNYWTVKNVVQKTLTQEDVDD